MVDSMTLTDAASLNGLLAIIAGMALVAFIISVVFWIYMSLAFTAMGRKAKLKTPALAWIPLVGPIIIMFQAAKMPAWPWFLLIGLVVPVVGPIALLVFTVYTFIWQWKMFEKIGRPGWWSLLCIISPVNLVLWGIAAWSKD